MELCGLDLGDKRIKKRALIKDCGMIIKTYGRWIPQ